LEGHSGHVLSLAFKPGDALLASGAADREVKVWDVKAREQKASIGPDPAAVTALAWPREGGKILVADEAGVIRQAAEGESMVARPTGATAPDVVYALAVTADGKHLYGGCHDGRVYAWDAAGKLEGTLDESAPEKK
jgi:WD40 repeat protein